MPKNAIIGTLFKRLEKIFDPYKIDFDGMDESEVIRIVNRVFDEYEVLYADWSPVGIDRIKDDVGAILEDFERNGDFVAFMECVRGLWTVEAPASWTEIDGEYRVSTGGWSGNEAIIVVMRGCLVFWKSCWVQSCKGEHHIFKMPERKKNGILD